MSTALKLRDLARFHPSKPRRERAAIALAAVRSMIRSKRARGVYWRKVRKSR